MARGGVRIKSNRVFSPSVVFGIVEDFFLRTRVVCSVSESFAFPEMLGRRSVRIGSNGVRNQ